MVFNVENADYSEYWAENVSRKMSGDMKSDNVNSRQEETEHNKNVCDEFLDLENEHLERHLGIEKCSSKKVHDFKSCSEEFKCNNFGSEKDYLKHYEESHKDEHHKKLSGAEEPEVDNTIRLWLENMEKRIDFIYNRETSEDYSSEEDDVEEDEDEDYEYYEEEVITFENCIGDPFTSVEKINEALIVEIISMVSDRKLSKVQGKCSIKLKDGTELTGSWQNGRRNGFGTFSGPLLDKFGVEKVTGNYVDGWLKGIGRIHMNDDSVREGWFSKGRADGPFKGTVKGAGLVWLGHYSGGVPTGVCWQAVLGSAWLVGHLDTAGQMTGSDLAFLYPDLRTALVGRFKNGELLSAFHSKVISVTEKSGVLVLSFEKVSANEFRPWISSRDDISCPPHLRDPYEDQQVEVFTSGISGSGEGLQARKKIPAGTLVAYYNGIRIKSGDKYLAEKNTGYAINLEWDMELRKNTDVLDILPEYQSTANYTSTLAHKVNHSFKSNCEWTHALHPCYGKVPAIFTLEDLEKGDELFIHYGYDMDAAPQWYVDFWAHTE